MLVVRSTPHSVEQGVVRRQAGGVLHPITDGLVTIRPLQDGDAALLIAGRDAEFDRYLGPAGDDPRPAGIVVVDRVVVGWVDHDDDRAWLQPGEVNLGYNVFAAFRGRGYATRAVRLLVHHLAVDTDVRVATLLIHPDNLRSLAVGVRSGFVRRPDLDGNAYFARPVAPLPAAVTASAPPSPPSPNPSPNAV